MEYIPSRDEFKHALHPTELKDRWNEIESYVYVISKRTRLHEMEPNDPPVNIFKIGVSTLRGKIQRMMDMRTFLISFKVHRLYLYERFQLAGDKKRREDSATYAYKAEQQLHNAVEHHFKPEKVRVSSREASLVRSPSANGSLSKTRTSFYSFWTKRFIST